MMGHVMNLFTQFIEEQAGPEVRRKVLSAAGLDHGEFRFEEVYPEEQFTQLVVATLETLELEVPELELRFAESFMAASPRIFPAIFELSGDAHTLLSRIPHIHRSIPSAASHSAFRDKLTVAEDEENRLLFRYDSPHKLCGLLKHLSSLTLAHYGETGEIHELQCARDGEDACLIEITFTGTE